MKKITLNPDRKTFIGCPERIAALGMMGDQLRHPLKPLDTIVPSVVFHGLEAALKWPPGCRETPASRTTVCVVFPVWQKVDDFSFLFQRNMKDNKDRKYLIRKSLRKL